VALVAGALTLRHTTGKLSAGPSVRHRGTGDSEVKSLYELGGYELVVTLTAADAEIGARMALELMPPTGASEDEELVATLCSEDGRPLHELPFRPGPTARELSVRLPVQRPGQYRLSLSRGDQPLGTLDLRIEGDG